MDENRNLKYKVFISYSRKDKELIQSFIELGDNREFELWIDEAEKKPGSDWRNTIRENINSSDGAILFITKNALDDGSPIKVDEIPLFIKRNNDPEDNFQFFPVFLDYVDDDLVKNYQFTKEGSDESEYLFDKYDIWNIEANNKNDFENEMPSEMSDYKRNAFWSDLNLNVTKALQGKKVSKIGTPNYWNSNKEKLKKEKAKKRKKFLTNAFGAALSIAVLTLLYLQFQPVEEPQSSEVFNIGGTVQLGALTSGDCFNVLDTEGELSWNSYVQYRACDLLHDGEVFYRENQLDFADNNVSYSGLLGLFSNTCNEQFIQFKNSSFIPSEYSIEFYWDVDSQSLGAKPFDMLCLTISKEKTSGSYVEDITGVRILLPNPGDKYDCENFNTSNDAQTWYELYFSDYGDIANLDLNGNGIACDELTEEISIESTSTTSSTTTTSTLPSNKTTTTVKDDQQSYYLDGVKDTMNYDPFFYESVDSWINGDYKISIDNYLANQNLQIRNFWKGIIEVKLSTPVLIAGPWATKVVINGEELGIPSPFNHSYNYNIEYLIGNLKENQDYKLEIYIVDALLREHGPMVLEFNGSDWNNDDNFSRSKEDFIPSSSGNYLYYFSNNEWMSKPVITSFNYEIRNISSNYMDLLLNIQYKPEEGYTGFSIGYFGIINQEIVLWGGGTNPVVFNHRLNIANILNKEIKIYVNHQMVRWADPISLIITQEMLDN